MICANSTIIHIKKNNTILIFNFQFIPNVLLLLTTVAVSGYNQMYEYLNTIMVPNHNTNCITLWLEQHVIFVKFYLLLIISCIWPIVYLLSQYSLWLHTYYTLLYTLCYTFATLLLHFLLHLLYTFLVHFYYTFVHFLYTFCTLFLYTFCYTFCFFASVSKGIVKKCIKWFTESVEKIQNKFYKGCTGNVQRSALESV